MRDNGLKIDVLHYIEHQLKSPITALLELLVDNPYKEVFEHDGIKPKITELTRAHEHNLQVAKRIKTNQEKRQHELTVFFKPVGK